MSLIFEYIFIIILLLGGYIFLAACGVVKNAKIIFAVTAGACIYVAIVYLQIIMFVPTYSLLTLSIFISTSLLLFFLGGFYRSISKIDVVCLVTCATFILVIIFLCHNFSLVKYHFDSLRYLIVSSLISSNNFDDLTTNLLSKRLSSVAILNSPAHLNRDFYFPGLLPVVGINLLLVMFYLVFTGVSRITQAGGAYLVAGASIILLLSINRVVWNGFYVNDHLIEALCLLTVVGAGWLGALRALPTQTTSVLQMVATIGVVMARPEGFIMAGLALLPTLLSGDVPKSRRVELACVWGLSIVVQQTAVLLGYLGLGRRLPHAALQTFGLGMAISIFSPALCLNWIVRHAYGILVAAELGLWLMLAILATSDWQMLQASAEATVKNVVLGQGGWGVSMVVLAGLVAAAALLTNAPARIFIRFPLTSFVPVAFILAYLREDSYRVGITDSLNRMIFHILPVAVLFVASVATSPYLGWRFRKNS